MNFRLVTPVLFLAALFSTTSWSVPLYLNAALNYDGAGGSGFIAYYDSRKPGMGDSVGGCFNCNICHAGAPAGATNTNAYANAWLTAWKGLEAGRVADQNPDANAVTAWQSIESMDSDGDSFTNIAEITAGSNPGDSTSTPTQPNCESGTSVNYGPTSVGSQGYSNPNALNGNCSLKGAAVGSIQNQKEDPLRDLQNILLYLLPLFVLSGLRYHSEIAFFYSHRRHNKS